MSGKQYVGQTTGKNKYYMCGGTAIKAAMKKYGRSNFSRIILEEGDFTLKQLDELEVKYMKQYNTLVPNGYNISTEGTGRIANGMEPWNKGGGVYTPEMIQAMSDAKKGKKASDQTKEKMSQAAKGKKKSPNVAKATKERSSKKIAQLSPFKNRIIHVYNSATDASKAVYADVSNICRAARQGTVSLGYKWKYI